MARTARITQDNAPQQEEVVEQTVTPQVEQPEAPVRQRRRNVFNGTTLRLTVNKTIPGHHLHVFTDTGMRIQEALEAGWEFVSPEEVGGVGTNVVDKNTDLGNRVRYLVNPRTGDGSEKFGYLMKLRDEWWEEDNRAKNVQPDRIDNAIRKGKVAGENPAFYIPKDLPISIKNNQASFQ